MSIGQEENAAFTDINVCFRLREERDRIGMSQGGVATQLGVTTKTVWRWEKQIPIPSDKLAELAELGFDVVFILTGQRSSSDPHALLAAGLTLQLEPNRDGPLTEAFKDIYGRQAKIMEERQNDLGEIHTLLCQLSDDDFAFAKQMVVKIYKASLK